MPLYDFKCVKCDNITEVFCSYDDSINKPPECCETKMIRIITLTQKRLQQMSGITFPTNGLILEHLPGGPKHFKTQDQMRKYAIEHDLELGALL